MMSRTGLSLLISLTVGVVAGYLFHEQIIKGKALLEPLEGIWDSRLILGVLAAAACVVRSGRGPLPPLAMWIGAITTTLVLLCAGRWNEVSVTGVVFASIIYGLGTGMPIAIGAAIGNSLAWLLPRRTSRTADADALN